MIQTLTEALDANSLEHKLEMQIKASLGDMSEAAYTPGEDYTDENMLQVLRLKPNQIETINTKDWFGPIVTKSCKDYLKTDKPFYLTDAKDYVSIPLNKALNKITEIEYIAEPIRKFKNEDNKWYVYQVPQSHKYFIVVYGDYHKWYLFT